MNFPFPTFLMVSLLLGAGIAGILSPSVAASSEMAVIFSETWESGTNGWTFTGPGADVVCGDPVQGCFLSVDPRCCAFNYVSKRVNETLSAPTVISFAFRGAVRDGNADTVFRIELGDDTSDSNDLDVTITGPPSNYGVMVKNWADGLDWRGVGAWSSSNAWYAITIIIDPTVGNARIDLFGPTGALLGSRTTGSLGSMVVSAISLHNVQWNGEDASRWDYDDIVIETLGSCNSPPTTPGAPTADGMGQGLVGWRGFEYVFSADPASDPDGDALTYTWDWGDGSVTTSVQPEATHSYTRTGNPVVTLHVSDGAPAHCRQGLPLSSSVTFLVIDDAIARLDRPSGGESCIAERTVKQDGVQVMAGLCTLGASPAWDAGVAWEHVTFRVDGTDLDTDGAAPYTATYDSLAYSAGSHVLKACLKAYDDKHDREACSPAHRFTNVGLS